MKLKMTALVTVLCMIIFNFNIFAADKTISLFLDSQKVECDVAPIIKNDRTLVPVRALLEAFGADVGWDGVRRRVNVDLGDKSIILVIDSLTAYVDGTKITLDSAPLILNDRTMVPIRFIAENLGFTVAWDSTAYSVNITSPQKKLNEINKLSWDYKNDTLSITIDTNDALADYDVFPLSGPSRIVLDLTDCEYPSAKTIDVNKGGISQIRFGTHEKGLRIVTDLNDFTTYNIVQSDNKKRLTLSVNATGGSQAPPPENETENPTEKEIIKSVIIDAGHGGSDVGAIGYDAEGKPVLYEKDVNLRVAKMVEKKLAAKGIDTDMTRTSDVYVPLAGRSSFANSSKKQLFVSIHSNSFTNSEANGTLTIYSDVKDTEYTNKMPSKDIANTIQKDLYKALGTYDRGIKSDPELYVLKHTVMPAVLVELAFISNVDDRALLASDTAMDKAAQSIADSIEYIINNQ